MLASNKLCICTTTNYVYVFLIDFMYFLILIICFTSYERVFIGMNVTYTNDSSFIILSSNKKENVHAFVLSSIEVINYRKLIS